MDGELEADCTDRWPGVDRAAPVVYLNGTLLFVAG
jgi:hypothetical protein